MFKTHAEFMQLAIVEAKKAFEKDEVPIGAVIVKDGEIIGYGYNLRESLKDPTLHAEIIAIRKAAKHLGGWRLVDCTLYVTIEPCPMCAGAIVNARIPRLVYGARDIKGGGVDSVFNITTNPRLNHRVEVIEGILEEECTQVMKAFFKNKRKS